jgi:hypothetical protein
MKRTICGLVALLVLVIQAEASITVNVTYTGDNVIGAFYQDGSSPVFIAPGPNAADWQVADTATLNLDSEHVYQLIFRVQNDTSYALGSGNPAAFMAQISGNVNGAVLTSAKWEYAIDGGTVPTDFNTLSWSPAAEYGGNGESNIWTSVHGGPISGISTGAEWIWAPYNFEDLATHPEYNNLWLRSVIDTIPEPASLLVWSLLVGLGIAMVRWQRRRLTA